MKQGNTREFLETIASQDAYVHYRGRFFFVNGGCTFKASDGTELSRLEMYELESDHGDAIADICSITKPTIREVMETFTHIPLIDGKTFWELENELEWV